MSSSLVRKLISLTVACTLVVLAAGLVLHARQQDSRTRATESRQPSTAVTVSPSTPAPTDAAVPTPAATATQSPAATATPSPSQSAAQRPSQGPDGTYRDCSQFSSQAQATAWWRTHGRDPRMDTNGNGRPCDELRGLAAGS